MMKLSLIFLLLFSLQAVAQKQTKMEKSIIKTQIGEIAIYQNKVNHIETPVIFLHGVYFDHNLWEYQMNNFTDRTVIALDMPLHGESKTNIKKNWTLDDCANMLLEILDSLQVEKVIAIGHSWGSMTILRAANKNPNRFESLGLCNMPFKETPKSEKRKFRLLHTLLLFRKLYMTQAGKSLMASESLESNPELLQKLITPMSKLTNKQIRQTDKAVIINSYDSTPFINNLTIPVIALVGEEDYVGLPPVNETVVVKGGHVSPLEVPEEVNKLISKLTKLAD